MVRHDGEGPSAAAGEGRAKGVQDARQAEGVRRLIARYCQLLDDHRDNEWLELFTEDALWVLGTREFHGRAAIKAYIDDLRRDRPDWWSKHLCTNIVVSTDNRETQVTSDLALLARTGAEPWSVASLGRYYDRLTQDAGGWKFAERRLEIR
jgi:3-phenylpropionate/cinnamic acid dioxygenase small subunit